MNIEDLLDQNNNLEVIGLSYKHKVHKINLPPEILEQVKENVREINIFTPRDLVEFIEREYPDSITTRVEEIGPEDYLEPNVELLGAFHILRAEVQMESNKHRKIWSFQYLRGN